MAAFYIDNDVALDVAVFLLRAGYAATHTSSLGLQTAHDGLQLLTATDVMRRRYCGRPYLRAPGARFDARRAARL